MRPSVFHQSKRNRRRPPESWAGKAQTRRRALEQHSVTGAEHAASEATRNLSLLHVSSVCPLAASLAASPSSRCASLRDPLTDGFGVNLTAAGLPQGTFAA